MATRSARKRTPRILKSKGARRVAFGLVAAGAAYAATVGTEAALSQGYRAARGRKPPLDPTARGARWRDVVGWAVATAVVTGLAQLLAQRGAEAGWTYATGLRPPRP